MAETHHLFQKIAYGNTILVKVKIWNYKVLVWSWKGQGQQNLINSFFCPKKYLRKFSENPLIGS